jgi:hypothetical protein
VGLTNVSLEDHRLLFEPARTDDPAVRLHYIELLTLEDIGRKLFQGR